MSGKWKRKVTNLMIRDFKILEYGFDFMGYTVEDRSDLSFHHLVVSHQQCILSRVPHQGYVYWNGAILVQDTSHAYLHTIEKVDRSRFEIITSHLITMNNNKELDLYNLSEIDKYLEEFEFEHQDDVNAEGKKLIKTPWIEDRIKFY